LLDPIVGIDKPFVSILLRLLRKPRDLIPAPAEYRFRVGDIGILPPTKIVEFNQVRQAITSPAAGRNAAFASFEDGIQVTDFQDGLLRFTRSPLTRNRLDAHGKGIEIQQTDPILDHAAGRLKTADLTPDQRRLVVDVLELIASTDARRVLEDVAGGKAGEWLAGEAAEALKRTQ
jgi:hypothetical protein